MTMINRTLYPIQSGFGQVTQLRAAFDKLQQQLGSGKKASTLAEMGTDRYFDLSLRARMGRIAGYQSNIDTVSVRLDMLDKVMGRLDTLEGDARTAMTPGGYGSGNINFGTAPSLAASRLDEVLTLLNTDVDGRYLFGGKRTDAKPVQPLSVILDGEGGRAGFRQVASERLAADLGASGIGRLTVGAAADTVTLAEDGAHTFGFKLSTASSSSAAVALTPTAGPPQSLAVKFNALPVAGETVTIGLTLPDGSTEAVTLKAVTGTPAAGEFQVGVDESDTAGKFASALQGALAQTASTKLAAASNYAAADNFFNGQGAQVLRVDGPPFDSATALIPADPATTVLWYQGSDSADPRTTVTARIDDASTASYGAQANETGPLALVRSLAVQAIQTFPTADPSSKARFDAIAGRNISRLAESHNSEPGSIEMMTVELGNAHAALDNVGDRHTSQKAQLQTLLDGIEEAPTEEVAAQILALQTRLTASYQAMALVSQLSLANYLQ